MTYTLLKEIGHGGMGCVYKGQDAQGHIVAIKMMSNKVTCYPEYRQLFQSEVDTLKRMDHPSVVHIVGDPYGDEQGNLYLPMEFIEGKTLEQCVNEQGVFPFEKTVHLMSNILEAMQYVHDKRRIHRDIKPSNIMYRPDGRICIIDFGIAKDARIGTGKTVGKIIGTDGYMSPEQANGLNIDCRTDIYSLGCVLYFLLTGKHAISKGNNDYETICNILKNIPELPSQSNPQIPVQIDKVFSKAVDKNMMQRYQSAYEFKEALEDASGMSLPKVSIGRLPDNDIVYDHIDISRKHLVIKWIEKISTGPSLKDYYLKIIDSSTNGTGVNGRLLKHDTVTIPFHNIKSLPDVFLAGRPEFRVNWKDVILRLHPEIGKNDTIKGKKQKQKNNYKEIENNKNTRFKRESLEWYVGIVCFVIPILVLFYWLMNRNTHPQKVNTASKIAAFGFIFWYVLTQIMYIIL